MPISRSNSFFRIIAILLVFVFIILIINAFSKRIGLFGNTSAESRKTLEVIQVIMEGISLYHANSGKMPPIDSLGTVKTKRATIFKELNDLEAIDVKSHEINDGWGTPMRINLIGNGSIEILSAGADEGFNTADDLRQFTPKY